MPIAPFLPFSVHLVGQKRRHDSRHWGSLFLLIFCCLQACSLFYCFFFSLGIEFFKMSCIVMLICAFRRPGTHTRWVYRVSPQKSYRVSFYLQNKHHQTVILWWPFGDEVSEPGDEVSELAVLIQKLSDFFIFLMGKWGPFSPVLGNWCHRAPCIMRGSSAPIFP